MPAHGINRTFPNFFGGFWQVGKMKVISKSGGGQQYERTGNRK